MKTINFVSSPSFMLTNVEFSQFMRDLLHHLGQIDKTEMTDTEMNLLIATLTAQLGDFDKVVKKVSKSIFSEQIGELDNSRDISIRALKQTVKTELLAAEPEVITAARAIDLLLTPYGNIAKLKLEEETRAIDEVVAELESAKFQPMVALLSIAGKVARVKADNEAFKTKYAERTAEYIAKDTTDNRELRVQANETYSMLCDYAIMMARLEKGEVYDKVVATINTIRTQYNAQQSRSATRKGEEVKS